MILCALKQIQQHGNFHVKPSGPGAFLKVISLTTSFVSYLSVSGFFARESLDFVSKLNVRKILITTLRADKFEEEYDDVYYLSKDFHKETRSIYALFGLKYFLEKISLAYINRFVRPN